MSRHSRSNTESHASIHSLQHVQDAHRPGSFAETDVGQIASSQHTLSDAIWERRAEFTKPDTLRIKVGTWNVASKSGTEHDLAGWFVGGQGISESLNGLSLENPAQAQTFDESSESAEAQEARRKKSRATLPIGDHGSLPGGSDVGIYALGLQEVVDINSATEALKPFSDSSASDKYRNAAQSALPNGYQLVAERQLLGMLLLVWAAPSLASHIRCVSTTSVGTGLLGYMGNKGAVTVRIVVGESTRIVFVNSHLSSGTSKADLDRRNWDAEQILSRTKFDPYVDTLGTVAAHGEGIGDEDFVFWFGDLNYRLDSIPADDVRRLLMIHTRKQYDAGSQAERSITEELQKRSRTSATPIDLDTSTANEPYQARVDFDASDRGNDEDDDEPLDPTSDPASLQTTLNSLLPHDELHQQMKLRRIFHDGWQEGPITFLPTYKYDVGSVGRFDSSDKRRGPSWCDRIIFRTQRDLQAYNDRMQEESKAKKRDEDMKAAGIDKAADDEATLFDYDPDADAYAEGDEEVVATPLSAQKLVTKEAYEDVLALEYYLSHQRVLSSDHKPLEAIFTLKYDAIVPDLKAKIHHEVARDLDRAENEGRPILTVIVDNHANHTDSRDGVDFGHVRYRETKSRTITLGNNGQVLAQFGFVNRAVGEGTTLQPSAPWLAVHVEAVPAPRPRRRNATTTDDWSAEITDVFVVEPGETCSIVLTVHVVDQDDLRNFNAGTPLEDVLVLRVRDGRDHFLPIHGKWQQSVYGRTIDKLSKIPEGGVRLLQHQRPSADSGNSLTSHNNVVTMWSAPREIYRLTADIEGLSERLLAEWSMLAVPDDQEPSWAKVAGWPFARESWTIDFARRESLALAAREALDNDQPFDRCLTPDLIEPKETVQILAEVLLTLLKSLEDGVVSAAVWNSIEVNFFAKRSSSKTATQVDDERATILEILASSRAHSVAFVLLTSMLAHLAHEIGNALQDAPAWSARSSSSDLQLASPSMSFKRKQLSSDVHVARRQLIKKNFTAIFADIMIRPADTADLRVMKATEEKRREIVGIFLGD